MTEQDRAAVRTAYRPLIDGLAGKPGTVSYDEWASAVDRVFPTDGTSGPTTKGQDTRVSVPGFSLDKGSE